MNETKKQERMDSYFSVFNLHVNKAGEKADAEFIKQFGQEKWDEVIKPLHEAGIMSIFHEKPDIFTMAWVTLCTAYANEGR